MNNFLKKLTQDEADLLEKSSFPDWYSPMLATLTQDRFSDPHWIYECKFDVLTSNSIINIESKNAPSVLIKVSLSTVSVISSSLIYFIFLYISQVQIIMGI